MVFVTMPPQPASKARMMFASDSVGGAEASRKGFWKRIPVNAVDRSAMGSSFWGNGDCNKVVRPARRAASVAQGSANVDVTIFCRVAHLDLRDMKRAAAVILLAA